ncbi:hypothetical protein QYB59_002086 [Clostridium perfringens]|nr:hypothetical protein [Clostridium perfringens]
MTIFKDDKLKNLTIVYLNFIVATISLIYVIEKNNNIDYANLFLLPLAYLVMSLFFLNMIIKVIRGRSIVLKIIFVVNWIRYILMPYFMVKFNNYSGYGLDPNKLSLDKAIFFMIYELIASMILIYILSKKNSTFKLSNDNQKLEFLKNKSIVIFGIFSCFILRRIVFSDGAQVIMNNLIDTSIFLLIMSIINKKYLESRVGFYKVLALIVIFFNMIFSMTTSRWNIIIVIIASLILYKDIFGALSKYLIIAGVLIFMIFFIKISYEKFSWISVTSDGQLSDLINAMISQIQDYFSGPRTIAQSIEMKELYSSEISFTTMINDYLGSVPIVSNFINQHDRINYYFNWYIFSVENKTTLIIPMISIGYIYFGAMLSPIFSLFCIWFVIKIENYVMRKNILEFKYVFMKILFMLSMYGGFNTQIIFGNFVSGVLPVYIFLLINKKVIFKGDKNKYEIKYNCSNI